MPAAVLFLITQAVCAANFPAVDRSTQPITIIYPAPNDSLRADGEFVLGSVIDQNGKLTINGQPVEIYKTGAFLAWTTLQAGTNTIRAELTLPGGATFFYERGVTNAAAPAPLPVKPVTIDPESAWPRQDLELRAGDWMLARVRGTAGLKAQWRLGKGGWRPMREVNPALGIYEGARVIGDDETLEPSAVEYKVGSTGAKSPGKVAISAEPPTIAAIKGGLPPVALNTGPGFGELFPAYPGARFVTGGRSGQHVKLVLPGGLSGWTEAKNLELLPPGAQPPRATTDVFSAKAGDRGVSVRLGLSERVPFSIDESEDLKRLTVRLYYTTLHTRWAVYNAVDPMIEQITFKQEAEGVVAVTIILRDGEALWGYQPAYEGSAVRIELRRAPAVAAKGSPLAGRVIFLDPGHMPSLPGTTGGLGTREMDVNYAIAQRVEARLAKEGAKPLMSRASSDDEVALTDRPKAAWEKKAEVYVSIHNNNLGSGTNPFKGNPHGYSVFYYHPHSIELGRLVYGQFEKLLAIPGEELRFGDLYVLRPTAMPAILTESAYLTYPEQEALLLDAKFRDKVAEGIVNGLRDFFAALRRRQAPTPAARKVKAAAP
jgi:N-acetylmuramoyl-L-alanine amidase